MNLYSANILPINKESKDFRNKSSKKFYVSFDGQNFEDNQNPETSKVNSGHIKAYFNADFRKKPAPVTYEELAAMKIQPFGTTRFVKDDQTKLVELSKEYPLAVRNLLKYKDGVKPRFDRFEIVRLAPKYEENPEAADRFIRLKDSDGQPRFNGYAITYLIDEYIEHPYAVEKLSKFEHKDRPRFNIVDIKELAKIYEESPEAVEELAAIKNIDGDPKFSGTAISYVVKMYKDEEMKSFLTENMDNIRYIQSSSSDNFFEINMDDKKIHMQIDSDDNCKIIGVEEHKRDKYKTEVQMKTSEGNTKTEQYKETRERDYRNCIETICDEKGNILSVTSLRPCSLNEGSLLIYKEIYDEDGNLVEVKDVGTVRTYGENHERKRIEKNYTSPLGVESHQLILEIPKGSRSSTKVNNTVFNRVTKKIDENTTETYAWGNKYVAKFDGDKTEITVTKKDGTSETVAFDEGKIDDAIRPLLKQLPADCLFITAKRNTKLSVVSEELWKDNAYFDYSKNEIAVSTGLSNDPFTFGHEYGHFLDDIVLEKLNQDEKLKEIFRKEVDAFKSQATRMSEEQIMYFLSKNHKNRDGRLTEVIAESTAIILGLPHKNNSLLLREKLLQENFPETIEYIGNKIQEAMA